MPSLEAVNSIEALVQSAIEREPGGTVWVGFSGGVDSTALLLACQRVAGRYLPLSKLRALHVNHGLQANAERWVEHCRVVCAQLEVPCTVASIAISPAGNLEANARTARWQVFAEHVDRQDLLLLGHHQQDQTETLLYRLFEGRGLLPMRSSGQVGAGRFARPLLSVERDDLRDYVAAHSLPWVEDESNQDTGLTRNFLRHKVIPGLTARWQGLHKAVQRVAAGNVATNAALQHTLASLADTVLLDQLPAEPAAHQAWLRSYLRSRGVYDVSDKALREFASVSGQGGHAQLDCGSAALHGYAGRLYFEKNAHTEQQTGQMLALGEHLAIGAGRLSLQPATPDDDLYFDYAGPLQVRFRQGGERLRIAPHGQTKTVKQIFSAARVPPWRRGRYPLLFDDKQLVCVPGLAVNVDVRRAGEACCATWIDSAALNNQI
jgi:tRNA(Ile)-lysidine synthase